ncbi:class I SAM-dependent methyltransferase [Streptomyces sp. NPDC088354]|uniref:class I SAM-dependent methyltransferase n=1 Tax=unclassified Streptomyces TaxID=2593676 RepID=UPI0029B3F19C|nr:class I SAM-dependent methyltransferase [Streptomyces sp. MI02-7b]MDX3072263.1 class I SAM-dependent methyltransferase [Streptomyces sp. MI02-7b]
MGRQRVELGRVQETLLIPLHARAVETARRRPLTRDPKAVELVEALDYDFSRIGGGPGLLGAVLRGVILDAWVREFLDAHPAGTVVELGAGLGTRYERLDNGTATWVDIDLPDVIALRRALLEENRRRHMVAGSVTEPGWTAAVEAAPGPYLFVSEAVLVYLTEAEVQTAIGLIARRFPGSVLLMDTVSAAVARRERSVNVAWSCDDPRALADWGVRVRDSRALWELPPEARARLTPGRRVLTGFLNRLSVKGGSRFSRFDVG